MSDSSRPFAGMPMLSFARSTAPLLAVAALCVVPHALGASVHHAVAPVRRGASTAHATAARHSAHAAVVAHHIPLEPVNRHAKNNAAARRRFVEDEDAPMKHAKTGSRGRQLARAEVALRAGRHALPVGKQSRAFAAHLPERSTAPGNRRPAARAEEEVPLQTASLRHSSGHPPVDSAADAGTQNRVHAWYGTQRTAGTTGTAAAQTPDLATAARKATSADFAQAAAAQRQTIRSAADQNSRQTTAADDAASAETHIPSTAPTEREPLPFVHGEAAPVPAGTSRLAPAPVLRQSLDNAAPDTATLQAGTSLARQATSTTLSASSQGTAVARRTPVAGAPISRVDLRAPAALTTQAAPTTAHVDLRPETRSATTQPVRVQPATTRPQNDATVLRANPTTVPADSSSRALRMLATETATTRHCRRGSSVRAPGAGPRRDCGHGR